MRVTLMHNPAAGDEQLAAEDLLAALGEAGHEAVYRSTKRKKFEKVLQDPGDLVVVAGGDGTVKKVATRLAGSGIPMAILPMGTANNIAKSLGLLWSAQQLIAAWPLAGRRRVDVGVVKAPWGKKRFLESVGGGVFARLISRAAAEVDENPAVAKGDEIGHALQLLARILHSYPTREWSITLDGRHLSGEYLLVEAMNIPLIGPNIPLSPNADPGDGQIDLVTLTEDQRDAFVAYIADRLAGNASPPEFTVHRGRRLQLFSAERELHVDDDLWPDESGDGSRRSHPAGEEGAELEISLENSALEVLVRGA